MSSYPMLLKSALHKTFRESAKCLFVIVSTLLVVLVSSQINTCAACAQLPNNIAQQDLLRSRS